MNVRDTERVRIWAQDFDSLLARGAVPQLSTIRLSNDHTSGQQLGKIAPVAAVADNDLALGQLVEHLSQSRIWAESVVLVLEDDAQNRPDHVDAHRSPAFVISPYTRRGAVDHTLLHHRRHAVHPGAHPRPAAHEPVRCRRPAAVRLFSSYF